MQFDIVEEIAIRASVDGTDINGVILEVYTNC
jgi:hypothetical protein